MKVLAAADIHGIAEVWDWLMVQAREHRVDAVILAGDLLGGPDGPESPEASQRHDAHALVRRLSTSHAPVFYVMGNDDLVELEPRSARVTSLHGQQVQLGRFTLVGYQYSLPFMGGTFEKPDVDIAKDLADLATLLTEQTVFVSHSPALGILDASWDGTPIGSRSIRAFLEQNPFLAHVHGHCHAGSGRAGKHFNVASGGQRRAMIIDLETMQHQVLEAPEGSLAT